MFPPELQVKRFVAELDGAHGFRWRVFTTGSDKHYLFSCVQSPTICLPVLKAELKPEVRSALAHGWGHAG